MFLNKQQQKMLVRISSITIHRRCKQTRFDSLSANILHLGIGIKPRCYSCLYGISQSIFHKLFWRFSYFAEFNKPELKTKVHVMYVNKPSLIKSCRYKTFLCSRFVRNCCDITPSVFYDLVILPSMLILMSHEITDRHGIIYMQLD